MKKVLCIVTAGKNSLDELRSHRLTSKLDAQTVHYYVDRSLPRTVVAKELWQILNSSQWDLVYQEGTGIAGGINLIRAALTSQQPFVVSSGDPIGGFFHTTKGPLFGNLFEVYERLLYKTCTGFIGWTPYLTGVAMKMGAKRAVTIEGGVDRNVFYPDNSTRLDFRRKYGIPADHLVCGVVGSLIWVSPHAYCYGYELVEVLKRLKRKDISFLIVGDGDGKSRLEQAVPNSLKSRVIFTGRLPETEVVKAINAMDIGFVTQIMGKLGNYRLTTKLPEYLACGVPVAMSPIPGFYDYVAPAGWSLPASHPGKANFHERCAQWLDQLSWSDVDTKARLAPEVARKYFDYDMLSTKFCSFIHELLFASEAPISTAPSISTLQASKTV